MQKVYLLPRCSSFSAWYNARSMKPLRVAVIGAGKLGARHAHTYALLPDVELTAVCDTNETRASDTAIPYKAQAVTDYRKLLGKVDAASIVVPSELHYKISSDFLKHGVHLLIEKPITTTLKDADKLLKLAQKNKLVLQVGHIERFNSAVRAIKNIIKKPRFIECHRLGSYDPRVAGTGVTLDLMIHDIDIVLDLIDSPVQSVDAVGAFIISKTEDISNVRLRFKNGSVCNLTASRMTKDAMRKIRIFQDDAYISLDYIGQEAVIHTKSGGQIHRRVIDITKGDSLKAELSDFVHCVRTGQKPLVSGKEARAALALALQIQKQIGQKNHLRMK